MKGYERSETQKDIGVVGNSHRLRLADRNLDESSKGSSFSLPTRRGSRGFYVWSSGSYRA